MSKNSSGNTPHISTEGVMREIEKTKSEVEAKQAELVKELQLLRGLKKPGTVIFFDLVGSTGYRRRYGSELGLMKAFLHNRTVTEAIERAGGRMVKWMGDGVLGCFSSERCGENHAFQALRAALGALQAIKALNQSDLLQTLFSAEKGEAYKESDHEVHTKIALCA